MIEYTLDVKAAAEARGVTTYYRLAQFCDLGNSHAAKLWNGEVKSITDSTITKLCNGLGCTPSDLYRVKRIKKPAK